MPLRSSAPLRPARADRPARTPSPAKRAGLALALTVPVLVAGVAAGSDDGADDTDTARSTLASALSTMPEPAADASEVTGLADRAERVSRSAERVRRPVTMKPRAIDQMWATAPLNVWTGPGEQTKRVGLVAEGTKLAATGQRIGGYAEVLLGDKRRDRWVNARYLVTKKPRPPKPTSSSGGSSSSSSSSGSTTSSGLSTAPCPDGSSIEAGLTSSADRVYRAVCNAFPALTTYGGLDPHGEHVDGRAIDFMVTDPALGNAIAQYLLANASTLNLRDIIWYQKIWTPDRASEGWRYMGERGSATANHMDHVHVAVY